MNRIRLILLGIIIAITSYGQGAFIDGYFIKNDNQRIECLIKNIDWNDNPVDFKYRITESGDSETVNIQSVQEFGIYNVSKYVRKTVQIDISNNEISELQYSINPKFKEKQVFLKALIEGKASLYRYKSGKLKRYFYNIKNATDTKQLVYRLYKTSNNKIAENNQFRQQLLNDFKCSELNQDDFSELEYSISSLSKLFIKYNECKNSVFINYDKSPQKGLFDFTLRPHFSYSSLSIENLSNSLRNTDFESKLTYGLGIEIVYLLPFYNNKWAIVVEPTFHRFTGSQLLIIDNVFGGNITTEIEYNSIEIPLSLRRYIPITSKTEVFLDLSLIYDVDLNSTIEFSRENNSKLVPLSIAAVNNFAFGAGFKIYNKYSLEFRYQTSQDILRNNTAWNSNYQTTSLILGLSF